MRFIGTCFFLIVSVCFVHFSFAQKAEKAQYCFQLLADRSYQSQFACVDEERNEYLRSFYIRSSGKSYIEVYDLTDGRLKQSIDLTQTERISVFVRTEGGEFWVFDAANRQLQRYDAGGQMQFNANEINNEDVGGPYTSYYADIDFNPLTIYQNRIYWVTSLISISGEKGDLNALTSAGIIREYDIVNDRFSWLGEVPKELRKNDYGYLNRFSYVERDGQLVIAPFYSNDIMVYGLENGEVSYPSIIKRKHHQVAVPFAPLTSNPKSIRENNAGTAHYRSNSHYLGLLYDKYRDVFYRVLITPREQFNVIDVKIVILDRDFNYVSDFDLPRDYHTKGMFVTQKGLNVFNYSTYKKDNSQLVYDSFTF